MKIGIIGLGLIGGSVALAAKKAGHVVLGFDLDSSVSANVLERDAISEIADIEKQRNECDLIIVCVPAKAAFETIAEALKGTAIVTDVSSTKQNICDQINDLEPQYVERFIGGHPMAGSEQSGFDASREDMFENKMWILVPPATSSLRNIDIVERFVTSLNAEHSILEPKQHDELVAYISHLPQLASSVLMDLAAKQSSDNEIMLRLAGGGFRDMTRIAASNVNMWNDIVHENKDEIASALDSYIKQLTRVRESIENSSLDQIKQLFINAKKARNSLPDAARRLENLTEILIPVPDKPGVLTTITSLAKDTNIYDIRIVHALEEDRGVLSLVVEPDKADVLINDLTKEGFEPKKVQLSSQ